jgi:hypothetical protein
MPDFDVLPYSEDHLSQSLANDLTSPGAIRDRARTNYLNRYLVDIGARTIIVEHDYTDGDYLDDFASYYVKCYHSYPRRCKRLHFFASHITREGFLDLVRGDLQPSDESDVRKAYLGFVIARPLPDAIIGRTAINTYSPDGGRRHYPCTRIYNANLFGVELAVRSLAFQEQDSVLAACATVSLWCAFHKTAELFGTPIPTPAEITRIANRVVHPARPIPSHGLNIQQICNSIRALELDPEVYVVKKETPLVSLIYGHLKMGLPVLLLAEIEGRGQHAIALNGFSLKTSRSNASEVGPAIPAIPMVGLRIDEFYGHDDQIGPFARLHVRPSEKVHEDVYPVVFDGAWTKPGSSDLAKLYPKMVVVPVYHKIRVTFTDIQIWITQLNTAFQLLVQPSGGPLDLEWDISLQTTNGYKKHLKGSGVAKDKMQELLLLQHPRFIWHVVLRIAGIVALELLVDATDMARSFPIYRAIWRDTTIYSALNLLLTNAATKDYMNQLLKQRFYDLLSNSPAP